LDCTALIEQVGTDPRFCLYNWEFELLFTNYLRGYIAPFYGISKSHKIIANHPFPGNISHHRAVFIT
ncbi:hypothetical protein, partial [Cylindrospermopsis raciborskii]|uniref:hypothetical protein n=1 Tax=Cylindrospermopsis raciborskii TaxID=77022 RepID=UPI0038D2007B